MTLPSWGSSVRDAASTFVARDSGISKSRGGAMRSSRQLRPSGFHVPPRSEHRARVRRRVHSVDSARDRARVVGQRRVLSTRYVRLQAHRERPVRAVRLHHRQRGEPARRAGVAGLQPRSDQAPPHEPRRLQLDRFGPPPTDVQRPSVRLQCARRRRPVLRGWTIDRLIDVHCDAIESNLIRYPNNGTAALAADNFPKTDYHFCDQSKLDMPFLHELKVVHLAVVGHPGERRIPELQRHTTVLRAGTSRKRLGTPPTAPRLAVPASWSCRI